MLDINGTATTDRGNARILLSAEEEPAWLEDAERWPSPMQKAQNLARCVGPEPEILDLALELARSLFDNGERFERDGLPALNYARALVILTEARRITREGGVR